VHKGDKIKAFYIYFVLQERKREKKGEGDIKAVPHF
jgi:hypothetical protein